VKRAVWPNILDWRRFAFAAVVVGVEEGSCVVAEVEGSGDSVEEVAVEGGGAREFWRVLRDEGGGEDERIEVSWVYA
jgi:hypothetical protein